MKRIEVSDPAMCCPTGVCGPNVDPKLVQFAADLDSLNEDKTFKSVDELKAIYEKAGVTADKNIITYCDTGVLATHSWFVMSELLGYKNVKVYDGSMREYANFFDVPMEPGVVGGQFPKTPIQELQEKVK